MNSKVTVFIATSLDGYIARDDGALDWLDEASAKVPAGEDCGYAALMESIDILVMGRKTYERVCSFGEWPYGEKPVLVMSRSSIAFDEHSPPTVQHSAESPPDLIARLSQEGVGHIYVDGGVTIQRFLNAGLVDEMIITVIPVLLGRGIPLFGSTNSDIALELVDARSYEFGFVQLHYTIPEDPDAGVREK